MSLPTSSLIEKNILVPENKVVPPDLSGFYKKPFIEQLFDKVRGDLEKNGDRNWLTNGATLATGSSLVFGDEFAKISEVEQKSDSNSSCLLDNKEASGAS